MTQASWLRVGIFAFGIMRNCLPLTFSLAELARSQPCAALDPTVLPVLLLLLVQLRPAKTWFHSIVPTKNHRQVLELFVRCCVVLAPLFQQTQSTGDQSEVSTLYGFGFGELRLVVLIALELTVNRLASGETLGGCVILVASNGSFQDWFSEWWKVPGVITVSDVWKWGRRSLTFFNEDLPGPEWALCCCALRFVMVCVASLSLGARWATWGFAGTSRAPEPGLGGTPQHWTSVGLHLFLATLLPFLALFDLKWHRARVCATTKRRAEFFLGIPFAKCEDAVFDLCRSIMSKLRSFITGREDKDAVELWARMRETVANLKEGERVAAVKSTMARLPPMNAEVDRVVALFGSTNVGKSSLFKALIFEDRILHSQSSRWGYESPLDHVKRVYRSLSDCFAEVEIAERAGVTVDVQYETLTNRVDSDAAGNSYLVDVPGIGLPVDHYQAGFQTEISVSDVEEAIAHSLKKLDVCVIVFNAADKQSLLDVYPKVLQALRSKYGLKPGSQRWHDAYKRILLVKNKADALVHDDQWSFDEESTWTSNRVTLRKRNVYLMGVAKLVCDELVRQEAEAATEAGVAPQETLTPKLLREQLMVSSVVSMTTPNDEMYDALRAEQYFARDFGAREILKRVNAILQRENQSIKDDAKRAEVRDKRLQLENAVGRIYDDLVKRNKTVAQKVAAVLGVTGGMGAGLAGVFMLGPVAWAAAAAGAGLALGGGVGFMASGRVASSVSKDVQELTKQLRQAQEELDKFNSEHPEHKNEADEAATKHEETGGDEKKKKQD